MFERERIYLPEAFVMIPEDLLNEFEPFRTLIISLCLKASILRF
jgi:hypothetical protein